VKDIVDVNEETGDIAFIPSELWFFPGHDEAESFNP
jgi:hypothetical protein